MPAGTSPRFSSSCLGQSWKAEAGNSWRAPKTVSGVFRDMADFAVLVLFQKDDPFGHPLFSYLPDGDLTIAPALPNSQAYQSTEWQMGVTTWTVASTPASQRALNVAGPGSVRIEEDSTWVSTSGYWEAAPGNDPVFRIGRNRLQGTGGSPKQQIVDATPAQIGWWI